MIHLKIFLIVFSFLYFPNLAAETFDEWKKSYTKRASKRGLSRSFLKKELNRIELNKEVIIKDKNQITSSKTIDYQKFMKKWYRKDRERLSKAKKYYKKYYKLLNKIEKIYGVDKEVIVAIWGAETYYGEIMGSFNILEAMASLAYDGRRRKFYERQLNAAFRLVKAGHIKSDQMKGSWAGATGQCQFMPSNIPAYGQDFNKDGRIDIWTSVPDVFASIAQLLKKAGWKKGKSIGSLVEKPQGLSGKINLDRYRTPNQYKKLGFNLSELKINWRSRRASEIPMKNSPMILRGSNYLPLLKWNNSSLFAAFNIIVMDELQRFESTL